ncbi:MULTISPECIES: energy transducer TonB [Amniculibacterium]|uniref:energy transducer TonB n=1 Tax=Amniculibacterium TaxID=2715289 RepID=UPI000F5B16A2|nr:MULTISPECIES: hypothetical protein [Amniculibacterium]
MKYKLFLLILSLLGNFVFSQQNEEFKKAKGYFDYQRYLLGQSFKKKFDEEPDNYKKVEIKKTFAEFMVKMDSVQNVEFVNILIKVKNNEILHPKSEQDLAQTFVKEGGRLPKGEIPAEYPGGMNELRKQVASLLYFDNVDENQKFVQTEIDFIVDKSGEITQVNAVGDNSIFNRQAEIAMYLLPNKFSPAIIDKNPVRYRFKMPLSMRFD